MTATPSSTTGARSRTSLYPTLLGQSWSLLAEEVRRMHADGSPVTAHGTMRVERSRSAIVRMLATLAGLPRPAREARIDLRIETLDDGEVWLRSFDGRAMRTHQFGSGGLLVERMRGLEVRFRLDVVDGALHYRHVAAAIAAGPLRITLPRAVAPVVEAWERAAENGRTAVRVVVSIPIAGRLVSYEGEMERTGEHR